MKQKTENSMCRSVKAIVSMANNQGRAPLQLAWNLITNLNRQQTSRLVRKLTVRLRNKEGLDKILFMSEGMEVCAYPQSCAQAQERLEKALASDVSQLSLRIYKHRRQNLRQT